MGVLGRLLGRARRQAVRILRLRGSYDAAQTSADNRNWWAAADGLSARQANSPGVRARLRNRARYEAANNCYASGIVRTLSEDAIGAGPRLQLSVADREGAAVIEREFASWCRASGLADKLLTMRRARAIDGESVAIMIANGALNHPVKLDLRLIEAEQLSAPYMSGHVDTADGIEFDDFGNPTRYHILTNHPGDVAATKWVPMDAHRVIHDFRADRPGQVRGIPELTPALPLFALLRAYSLATLQAAESIANFAAVAFTDAPGDEGADDVKPFEEIELQRNMMTAMPRGWKIGQIKPEQPASTYREFKREVVAEIGRAFAMPFIVAAGDSAGSSYAAGRMDYQCYRKAISVDRAHIERTQLDRIYSEWIAEATRIDGYLPADVRRQARAWRHSWMWDGWEHVDPLKEANALAVNLASNVTTIADEWAKKGIDWEDRLELIAKIEQRKAELAQKYKIAWPGQPVVIEEADDDDDGSNERSEEINAAYSLQRDDAGRLIGLRRAAS